MPNLISFSEAFLKQSMGFICIAVFVYRFDDLNKREKPPVRLPAKNSNTAEITQEQNEQRSKIITSTASKT